MRMLDSQSLFIIIAIFAFASYIIRVYLPAKCDDITATNTFSRILFTSQTLRYERSFLDNCQDAIPQILLGELRYKISRIQVNTILYFFVYKGQK